MCDTCENDYELMLTKHEAEKAEILEELKYALDVIADAIVQLAAVDYVKLTKEQVIQKSTDDSPLGRVRASIKKYEANHEHAR